MRPLELTLEIEEVEVAGIVVDGRPLVRAGTRAGFQSGTFWCDGAVTLAAFDPQTAQVRVEIKTVDGAR